MRLAQVAAGTMVGMAVLTGCSSGPEPANDTLPSAAPTSAEASETLPPLGPPDLPMPPEAREQTPEGAEAALRYYLALISRQEDLGGAPLRELSRDCEFCDFLADRYDKDAAAGYVYQGGDISITAMSAPALSGDVAEFSLSLDQGSIDILRPDGQPVAGRGEPDRQYPNVGASMTWSETESAWYVNQLVVNE